MLFVIARPFFYVIARSVATRQPLLSSLRGAVGDVAIMSLRGDEVPAATSYINVRLLRYVRND